MQAGDPAQEVSSGWANITAASVESSALSGQTLHGDVCDNAAQENLETMVIYATSSIDLDANVKIVSGDVGVRDSDPPTAGLKARLNVGWKSTIAGTSVAKTVALGKHSEISAVFTDQLTTPPGNSADHGPLGAFPAAMPTPPSVEPVATGTVDVSVFPGDTRRLNPGAYRSVVVKPGGKLILNAGSFSFRALDVRDGAQLIADGQSEVDIAETLKAGIGSRIRPRDGQSTDKLVIRTPASARVEEYYGRRPTLSFGALSAVRALIVGPEAYVLFHAGSSFTGAMVAKRVELNHGVKVAFHVGIEGEPCVYDCEGLDLEDENPCTEDTCDAETGVQHTAMPFGALCGERSYCIEGECTDACEDETIAPVTNDTLQGSVSWFGESFPEGAYEVRYVDGCMKYNHEYWWSVQAVYSGEFTWYLIGDDTNDKIDLLPGLEGFWPGMSPNPNFKPGFEDFAACVAANKLVPALVVDHTAAGPLGVHLTDNPLVDNVQGEGGNNPTWSLTRIGNCEP